LSRLVVAGTVLSQVGEFHPEHGIETAVTLEVTDVLKGRVRPGERIVFHTRGGQVGEEVSKVIGEAQLQTGTNVLVFVEQVDGRLYNLGLSMGVWDTHVDAAGRTVFTRSIQDGLEIVGEAVVERGPLSLAEVGRRVEDAVRRPEIDSSMLRETRLGSGGR
jgi:hypothetical protein